MQKCSAHLLRTLVLSFIRVPSLSLQAIVHGLKRPSSGHAIKNTWPPYISDTHMRKSHITTTLNDKITILCFIHPTLCKDPEDGLL
jgi:hypothetical protein